jgi:predicted dehydrogenase
MSGLLRWGVLGASSFALRRSLPGMLKSRKCQIFGIASRTADKARAAALKLDIPRAYGSYEELLADPEIDAIYNPLPNHLHVPWSLRAVQAGKHVLCEKPVGLSQAEILQLIAARDRARVKVGEAFMVATHPQWLRARELVRSGVIGPLQVVQGSFSYMNDDPANYRNKAESGGGGLLDIGCYPIFTSRFVSGEEPRRVAGLIDTDPRFNVDRITSAILDFPSFQASFFCATQLIPRQRMAFYGARGRVELQIPFNAPPDRPVAVSIDRDGELYGAGIEREEFPVLDQYAVQADAFAEAVCGERADVAVPLEDSLRTMAVMEAIVRSTQTGRWEPVMSSDT